MALQVEERVRHKANTTGSLSLGCVLTQKCTAAQAAVGATFGLALAILRVHSGTGLPSFSNCSTKA